MNTIIEKYSGYVECWDDVSNMPLNVKLIRAAPDLEMEFFKTHMEAWSETIPKATVKAVGGKVIQSRCVDANKGDSTAPDYRARFVGKEFITGIDPTLYAAHPHWKHCILSGRRRTDIVATVITSCFQM